MVASPSSLADLVGLVALRFDAAMRLTEATAQAGAQLGSDAVCPGVSLRELEAAGALYPGVTEDAQAVRAGLVASEKQVRGRDGAALLVRIAHDPTGRQADEHPGVVIRLTDVSAFFHHHEGVARALAEVADYKHALDRSSILSMTDREGRIVHVNDLFCQVTGYSRSELIGKNHRIVNSGYHPKAFMAQLWSTILAGDVWSGTIRNRAKDGTYHWVYTTIVPLNDNHHKPVRFLAIRNLVRAPADEATPRPPKPVRPSRWFDDAPVGVALTNAQGLVDEANAALLKLLDRPEQEVVGSQLDTYLPDDHDLTHAWMDVFAGRRESVRGEYQLKVPGQRVLWVRLTTWRLPTPPGHPSVLAHMFEDTSSLHEAAIQLRNTSQLAKLGEMAAVVAHEVKNPLAGIGGALQIISERLPEATPEREILGEIQARLHKLNELVNGLSRFARPIRVQHPMQTNLMSLIGNVASTMRRKYTTTGITCEEHGDCLVDGDLKLLEEMFTHLLDNACRVHRGGKRPVRVRLTATPTTCIINISDHGPGLSPEVRARLFDPFFTTRNQGVGLGLAQARRIALAHGGEVRVAATGPDGTSIAVELPRQRR